MHLQRAEFADFVWSCLQVTAECRRYLLVNYAAVDETCIFMFLGHGVLICLNCQCTELCFCWFLLAASSYVIFVNDVFLCLFAFDIQHSIYCVQLTSVFFCRLAVVSVSCVYFLRLSMLWLLAGQLDYKNASSSPLMDNTWIMMIVWRTRRKISRTAMCCVVYHRCA